MIVHAPYIHTGGGKTLLSEFVNFNNKSLEIYLDKKYPYENIDKNNYKKIKNNFFHTLFPNKYYESFTETEHIHFYGFYLGNFPSLPKNDIEEICKVINAV